MLPHYTDADLTALRLTFELALCTSALLVLLATPLALWIAWGERRGVIVVVESLVSLPLVLPPTVLGFYLLLLLGPEGPLGRALAALGIGPLPFSFGGILLGSLVYSLPFAVQPLVSAFLAVNLRMREAAATLRASPWATFFGVTLPLARRGFISAAALSFAHTLGEFGVVLMIGGAIPGRTETASIAIFRYVEALDEAAAHRLSATLLAVCFGLLLATNALLRVYRRPG